MTKRPWYIWLSVPAVLFLIGRTAPQLRQGMKDGGEGEARLWQDYVRYACFVVGAVVFLPFAAAALLTRLTRMDLAPLVQWLLLYLAGVYGAHKHVEWQRTNLPQIP